MRSKAAQFSPFFFFNDTATTEIYTLSLHDALPISASDTRPYSRAIPPSIPSSTWPRSTAGSRARDRKSTRLNSSHVRISYAVFCLKKKKKKYLQSKDSGQELRAINIIIYFIDHAAY